VNLEVSVTASAPRSWTVTPKVDPGLNPTLLRFRAHVAMRPLEKRGRDRAIRALNIFVAVTALVITAPVMCIIALLVKATSRGPAIYRQPRVGLDRRQVRGPAALNHRRRADQGGRIFTIYKFRTMYADARQTTRQVWASANDPRITPVGRVLRQFRLDELPQLFNVLKGDMNIVGPRPEQPAIFDGLRQELDVYRKRQRVLPGITGLAQITLPYDTNVNDVKHKVDLDLEYIRRRSVGHDLLIMAKTMPVMVFRKGSM
jgi:lipopolysaccharide/colanic/teichoic acid biosynthesis glycosyltransferase